jgi:hypothetical protein
LAAGSLIAVGYGAPVENVAKKVLRKRVDTYRMYTGTVSAADWPSTTQWWNTFEEM